MSKKQVLANLVSADVENMSHEELMAEVLKLRAKKSEKGLKERILDVMADGEWRSNAELAEVANGKSPGNVSSYLSYLRGDGFIFVKDGNKRNKLVGKVSEGKRFKLEGGEFVEGEILVAF